jgi:hypothetical protein
MGLFGLRYAPASLTPGNGPDVHCTGGWVGRGAGLEGCGKSRPHRRSNRAPRGPSRVNITTALWLGVKKRGDSDDELSQNEVLWPGAFRLRVKGRALKPLTLSRTDQRKCAWNIAHDFFFNFLCLRSKYFKIRNSELPLLSTTYYWVAPHFDCNGPVHNSTIRA